MVFTDNSAFHVQRTFNASATVGANTYPYVNGIVWEPAQGDGNSVTIAINRPGGVMITNGSHDTLGFFLTRKIDNVNIDKGLPDRLDDTAETRMEFAIGVTKIPGVGLSS
jgi:hypothetical protein